MRPLDDAMLPLYGGAIGVLGALLGLPVGHLAARALVTSSAWIVYALLIFAVGLRHRSVGLRWLSLGLLITTLGKVFLRDLSQLQDLNRVASLVGLALSLLSVSLRDQRLVFGNSSSASSNSRLQDRP